jgi:heme-degrading monooxygenase HmoA
VGTQLAGLDALGHCGVAELGPERRAGPPLRGSSRRRRRPGGFEGFELLRPTDGRNQWLVVTRWRDDDAFNAWVSSPAFAHGHAGADRPSPHGGPVSVGSELWAYEVAGGSAPG